ncbi:MAG: nucleotide exchange factor GrpE [Candidatus Wallbacteria bacterium]|nr:nucleotide exchange factor GrpE [Candidatus Wallbacteria bacterium]
MMKKKYKNLRQIDLEKILELKSAELSKICADYQAWLENTENTDKLTREILAEVSLPEEITREEASTWLAGIFKGIGAGIQPEAVLHEAVENAVNTDDPDAALELELASWKDIEGTMKKQVSQLLGYTIQQSLPVMKERRERERLEKEVENYRKQAEEYLELSRVLKRDYARMKERLEKEKADIVCKANRELICKLLEVLDGLDEAVSALAEDESREQNQCVHCRGVGMVYQKFLNLLNSHHVSEMQCLNTQFDPVFHEALCQDLESSAAVNTITGVFRKGYMMGGEVLRSSLVKVAVGTTLQDGVTDPPGTSEDNSKT